MAFRDERDDIAGEEEEQGRRRHVEQKRPNEHHRVLKLAKGQCKAPGHHIADGHCRVARTDADEALIDAISAVAGYEDIAAEHQAEKRAIGIECYVELVHARLPACSAVSDLTKNLTKGQVICQVILLSSRNSNEFNGET